MTNNKQRDPIKVNKKNNKLAYTLRFKLPQKPTIKNIGIKTLSNIKKKLIKSIALKTPTKNNSKDNRQKQYSVK
jgi:hypothetical protein